MDAVALLQRWNVLPARVRTAATLGVPLLAGIAALAFALAHPAREPLFPAPLRAEQVAEVERQLAAWNVAFVPSANNILVVPSRRNALLLRLALAGVPHAHLDDSGDALASVGALTPQSVIDAQARRGLEGDIALALRGIAGIDDAQVLVTPAQSASFADESSQPAAAGVRLHLAPGTRLSRENIEGIRRFVASAVPGLAPARVAVLDDRGAALDGDASGGEEERLQAALQSALDQSVGAGTTIVRVHLERDPRVLRTTEIRTAPVSGPPVADDRDGEHFTRGAQRYERDAEHVRRGTERSETVIERPAGSTRRLFVAVVVDERLHLDVPAIRALAIATTGADATRGDVVSVQAVPFAAPPSPGSDLARLAGGIAATTVPALVVAIAAIIVVRKAGGPFASILERLVERGFQARRSGEFAGYPPARVRSALAGEPPHTAAAIISALPVATAAAVLDLYPASERSEIVRRMQRARSPVVPDPDEVLARV